MNIPALQFHPDGDFYCARTCKRCQGTFYVYAICNSDGSDPLLCDWCKGKCTASEQARHNLSVESYIPRRLVITHTGGESQSYNVVKR